MTEAALGKAEIAALHRDLLRLVPRGRASDLYGAVLPALIDARAPVNGYMRSEYARDIGTPERVREVEADVRAGRARLRAELALLERDGVLTEPATCANPRTVGPDASRAALRASRSR